MIPIARAAVRYFLNYAACNPKRIGRVDSMALRKESAMESDDSSWERINLLDYHVRERGSIHSHAMCKCGKRGKSVSINSIVSFCREDSDSEE